MRQLSDSRLENIIGFYKKICEILNHAFLITAHTYFEQLEEIIGLLRASNHFFYINIDRKSNATRLYWKVRNKNRLSILYMNSICISFQYQINNYELFSELF